MLAELVETERMLIVLDNLETLLSDTSTWLDPRMQRVLAALTEHHGHSRVVLTSRTVPADLDRRVLPLPINTLSRDESALLARELPNLRQLLHDTEPARGVPSTVQADRQLLQRALTVVQGHPKLLELADAAARTPHLLAQQVQAAEQAMERRGAALAAFLAEGDSALDPDQLLAGLSGWTTAASSTLPAASHLLLQALAAMEPDDRFSSVLNLVWPVLWQKLQPQGGKPPELAGALQPLLDAALIDSQPDDPAQPSGPRALRLHPGVAETIRATTQDPIIQAVDRVLAAFWTKMFDSAQEQEQQGYGGVIVHAALAAAPYHRRQHEWDTASRQLEHALRRNRTPGTVAAVLPLLRRIADATHGTDRELTDQARLALALRTVDPQQAEHQLRQILQRAIDRQQHGLASQIATDLVNLLRDTGRLREALALTEQTVELSRRAGTGPWTQLGDTGQRLQILYLMGQAEEVLDQIAKLRPTMTSLPQQPGDDDRSVAPWNVREIIVQLGVRTALDLNRFQDALELNAELLASKQQRGASEHELASTRFYDHAGLLRLGRLDDADQLLLHCQGVFEQAEDPDNLGAVLGARAHLAAVRGHGQAAVNLERAALRFKYLHPDPAAVAAAHNNLAASLKATERQIEQALAHLLAAALLRAATCTTRQLQGMVRALAAELQAETVPATIDRVRELVEQVPGVRFAALLHAIQPDPDAQQALLDQLLRTARTLRDQQTEDLDRHLRYWEPLLSAMLDDATTGAPHASQAVQDTLDEFADHPDWAELVARLRRVLGGERDPEALLADLDPTDTAILTRLLDALAGSISLTPRDQTNPELPEHGSSSPQL